MKKTIFKNTLCILIAVCVLSCSSSKNSEMKGRTLENFYIPTGVGKYFLSDIPTWANFDQFGRCFRPTTIRYFDIDALMKSYGINYSRALQVQSSFNEEISQVKKIDIHYSPSIKEEELLFFKVNEKVGSQIVFFDPPTFSRINLVWLDEILGDAKKEQKLIGLLNSSAVETGVPVLVSFCLTKDEVENRFPHLTFKMITAELFSIYNRAGNKTPGFKIDLSQFFLPTQKIYFYSQEKIVPNEKILGTYKILNY